MSTDIPISPPRRKKSLPPPQIPMASIKSLKIMSWNVAALRTIPSKLGTTEFHNQVPMRKVLNAFFKKYQVDIACFQEHKFSNWDKLEKDYACIDGTCQ
jgi:mRNA deadenylase 3'-5' endonuclease subunit Ccr4